MYICKENLAILDKLVKRVVVAKDSLMYTKSDMDVEHAKIKFEQHLSHLYAFYHYGNSAEFDYKIGE